MSAAGGGGRKTGGGDDLGRLGWLTTLRRIERETTGPRIGRNRRLAQEAVRLGQDPFLAFPTADFAAPRKDGPPGPAGLPRHLRSPILGLYGPHGALPLNTTEEVLRWLDAGEGAFVAFTDIFASRFIQLFFRAWSDAHPISQHDRPDDDRFQTYVGAVAGVATPAFRNHDGLPDTARLPLVSLFGGRVRSPVRLRQMLRQHLGVDLSVEEHVPGWLEFDESETSRLGQRGALGQSTFLGARLRSVNETIRLHIRTRTLEEYRRFLPGGASCRRVADIVFWYLGRSYDVEVVLSLPADQIAQTRLGQAGDLGWMAALPRRPRPGAPPDEMTEAATYRLRLDAQTPPEQTDRQTAA
ncbi:MAG: type VI secretion system baseplate subunit TssG [Paracoccus sp. (in: a-proteobacteria)]|nr:type VI secretion system baseplate subunit TssG [Paracoccus sp. (in: a-proteobacteria)]